jgi:hypothetical protein
MKRATRIALGSAALAACLGFAGASRANAQVRFEGSFPLPHGRISVGVGDPTFPNGSFVPDGYSVYDDPEYGYGFAYGDEWVSCRPYGRRWVIVERRPYFGSRGYGSRRFDRRYQQRYSPRFWRDDHRRFFRREDRRSWDDRRGSRRDHGSRPYDRWSR